MDEILSISAAEFHKTGRIFFSRWLDNQELCATTNAYRSYLKRHKNEGLCFGVTLCWVCNSLKNIRVDEFPFSVGQIDNKFYDLNKFDERFFDHSSYIHYAAKNTTTETGSYQTIINTLNKQEAFLFHAQDSNAPRFYCTRVNNKKASEIIQLMLLNRDPYKNTAMVLSTSLPKPIGENYREHSTALINYHGRLFYFDPNRGVYHIADPENLHWTSFLITIKTTLRLNTSKGKYYGIDNKMNIFVQI